MQTQAGIWVDHREAIVILISGGTHTIQKLESGAEHTDNAADTVMADDKQERKLVGERRKFHDEVIVAIGGAKAILICGPGEAKGELMKHIESKKLHGISLELETAGRMTDPQLAAKVTKYFSDTEARKVSPAK